MGICKSFNKADSKGKGTDSDIDVHKNRISSISLDLIPRALLYTKFTT